MQRCSTKLATLGRATARRPPFFVRVVAAVACLLVGRVAPAQAETSTVLPIAFHVVRAQGAPVVSDEWLEEQVARANAIFAATFVSFARVETLQLDAAHAALENAADRNALGARTRAGVINCFVVASLRDVDDTSQMRRGVHWRSRTHAGAHYVILASSAPLGVLAHELGHFLGNPQHSDSPGNLMSYSWGTDLPALDALQMRRVRRSVAAYLKRRELRAVPADPSVL